MNLILPHAQVQYYVIFYALTRPYLPVETSGSFGSKIRTMRNLLCIVGRVSLLVAPRARMRLFPNAFIHRLEYTNERRYRGTAVTVEDRDQTYDFVDVRDVVVLDPDVECHPRCLLRGAVDPFQQRGWEFSVQVRN